MAYQGAHDTPTTETIQAPLHPQRTTCGDIPHPDNIRTSHQQNKRYLIKHVGDGIQTPMRVCNNCVTLLQHYFKMKPDNGQCQAETCCFLTSNKSICQIILVVLLTVSPHLPYLQGSPRKVGFLMVEVNVSFEALVLNYQSAWCHISEDCVFKVFFLF